MASGFIIVASVVFLCLVLVLVTLTRHLAAPPPLPVTAEWIAELSIDATSLVRLLDNEEFHSFHTQATFAPRLATKLRIQRCHLLHDHLRHLENDFKLTCMALKVIIVQSKNDRPDLARALVRNQITFTYGMMMVRFRMVRYRFGL